jgi:P-type E1-E2 ATPase
VQALQRTGWTVAMTGDGANDAPAIRLADVGVAVGGAGGIPAARSAADVVIADDRVEPLSTPSSRAARCGHRYAMPCRSYLVAT